MINFKKLDCKYCGKKVKGPAYRFIMNEETKKLEPAHPECHKDFVSGNISFWIKNI